jgi:hypothetical protein
MSALQPVSEQSPIPPEPSTEPLAWLDEQFLLFTGREFLQDPAAAGRRAGLATNAAIAALISASVYGVAAGASDPSLALWNVFKLPAIVIVAALGAAPLMVLAWKVTAPRHRSIIDLFAMVAAAHLGALATMAACAPLIGLYTWSSQWGGLIAALAPLVAIPIGIGIAWRYALDADLPLAPVITGFVVWPVLLFQLVAVASPIIPDVTVFDGGVDGLGAP